jgi:predicted nucleotidyltransferase
MVGRAGAGIIHCILIGENDYGPENHQADLHPRAVKSISVIGSLGRGETAPTDFIDIMVEFDRQERP